MGVFYVRFMDDILILALTRWQLRRAVKVVNQTLGALDLEKHPDKTFIGAVERGFDFLGYHFSPAGLAMAAKTIANFIEKASRLYEQKRGTVSAVAALGVYVRRWVMWAHAGLGPHGPFSGTPDVASAHWEAPAHQIARPA
jgi:RNA-directed DNA polymerase